MTPLAILIVVAAIAAASAILGYLIGYDEAHNARRSQR